jgi:hypothetical protein
MNHQQLLMPLVSLFENLRPASDIIKSAIASEERSMEEIPRIRNRLWEKEIADIKPIRLFVPLTILDCVDDRFRTISVATGSLATHILIRSSVQNINSEEVKTNYGIQMCWWRGKSHRGIRPSPVHKDVHREFQKYCGGKCGFQ